jgi:SnoaL-like domain
MSDNTTQIEALIENWAEAVHRGDLDAVLADHSDDIVMFDVPPPEDGVRGIARVPRDLATVLHLAAAGCIVRDRFARRYRRGRTWPSRTLCCTAARLRSSSVSTAAEN